MSAKTLTTWTIGVVALASAGPLPAHHSLAQFDLTTPIWLQGIVVGFERINPHSIVIAGISITSFCKQVMSSSSAALR